MNLITSLLSSLTGGAIGSPPQDDTSMKPAPLPPTVDPNGNPIDPNAPTQMDELVGTIPAKPKPPARVNYYNPNMDNSQAVQDAHNTINKYQPADDKSGLYGILPHNVRQGTLRNVLGALGDAFLVQSGNKPTYQPALDRQRMGDAAIGSDQDYGAASNRIYATGTPGSAELADKVMQQGEQAKLRQAYQDNTAEYRNQRIAATQDGQIRQRALMIGGQASKITDPAKYKQFFNAQDATIKSLYGDNHSATEYNLPLPEEWQPHALDYLNTTGGQVLSDDTKKASIQERYTANANNNATARRGQNIRGAPQPTASGLASSIIEKHRNGIQTTPDEDAFLDTYIHGKKSHSRGLLTTSATPQPSGGAQQPAFSAYANGPHGRIGYNGHAWVLVPKGQ